MREKEFLVRIPEGQSIRADKYVSGLGLFSRSQVNQRSVVIRNPQNAVIKHSHRLKNGEKFILQWEEESPPCIKAQPMDMDVLFEDEHCLVIDKQQGVVVHPAPGHSDGTLVNGLMYRYAKFEQRFDDDLRPGIVHRLDKDTSGLIIIAKNTKALSYLSDEFKNRRVEKTYLAITNGLPPLAEGLIDTPIGRDRSNRKKFKAGVRHAKEAKTRYKVLSKSSAYALVEVGLLTGRTHQIRVHFKSLDMSLVGDSLYGKRIALMPQISLMLHSWKLLLKLPDGRQRSFEAKIPERFYDAAQVLGLTIQPDFTD